MPEIIPLRTTFASHSKPLRKPEKRKRPSPISLRLNDEERERLKRDAAGMSMNAYIRDCLFGPNAKKCKRRGLHPVKDHQALAQVLSALGRSGLCQDMKTIAHAVRDGSIHLCPDVERSVWQACNDIAAMRRDLVAALGLKPER